MLSFFSCDGALFVASHRGGLSLLFFDRTTSKFKLTNRVVVDIENGHHELDGPVTGPILSDELEAPVVCPS